MLSAQTFRKRALEARAAPFLDIARRYVDFAVEVRVIERDEAGGYEVDGFPFPYRLIETHRFGGKLDAVTKRLIGPASKYVVCHCSPKQWALIQPGAHTGTLLMGGEGSGKSQTAAIWTLIRIVSRAFPKRAQAGATAPTDERLDLFRGILESYIPKSWGFYRAKKKEWVFRNNLSLKFVGTKKYSEAIGSRVQGYTWGTGGFVVSDEVQDYTSEVLNDIEARGRGSQDGRFYRFNTATPKDDSTWRNFLGAAKKASSWLVSTVTGYDNIFVPLSRWEALRNAPGMTEREFRRRVLAEDLPPETLLYYGFNRERNIKSRPLNTQLDITRIITRGFDLVIGHDPGTRQDTSVLIKAYRLTKDGLPSWWVLGEVITAQSSTFDHAQKILDTIRGLGIDPQRTLILTDPHETNQEASPLAVIRQFQMAGLRAERASASAIQKKDRIDMVNSLLFNPKKESRLFIDADSHGLPAAPVLTRSLENQVRDALGKAETGKKDETDLTHTTASLGYGLHSFERVSIGIPIETGLVV